MRNNARAFVNQILICVLVTLCGSGAVGVGTVWMRHQVSRTADNNRALEASIQRLKRQLAETTALIESAQNPTELRHRNEEFKLGLEQVVDQQVVHVAEEAGERLSRMRAKANHELLKEGVRHDVAGAPQLITFKVAQH